MALIVMFFTLNAWFPMTKPNAATIQHRSNNSRKITSVTSEMPLLFIENVGQFHKDTRFKVLNSESAIWLAEDALWITSSKRINREDNQTNSNNNIITIQKLNPDYQEYLVENIRISFTGSNPSPSLTPIDRLDTHVSYFLGNEPDLWYSDVPVWRGIRYNDIYPGIDLEVSGDEGSLALKILASNGGKLNDIRLKVEGANKIEIIDETIYIGTEIRDLNFPLLNVETSVNNILSEIITNRKVDGNEIINPFTLYPSNQIISNDLWTPLRFGVLIGEEGSNKAQALVVDENGYSYISGWTNSSLFPTNPGSYKTNLSGPSDVFIIKLNPDGEFEYTTFLGGKSAECDYSYCKLALDNNGNVYITGYTSSSDFPISDNAFDKTYNGSHDAFLSKLNPDGNKLVFSTYLGGSDEDHAHAIMVDDNGNTYVAGYTLSKDFPTTDGVFAKSIRGAMDVFITKVDNNGSNLVFSTYLGGSGDHDAAGDIILDDVDNIYIVGSTDSDDFPMLNPIQSNHLGSGSSDVFLTKLGREGREIKYSTYLGGRRDDYASSIVSDINGDIYVTGRTKSEDFLENFTENQNNGDFDAFVVKLNRSGTDLIYATYIGGWHIDVGYDIAVDSKGSAYITGYTMSSNFPTTKFATNQTFSGGDCINEFGIEYPCADAIIASLSPDGKSIEYATYVGGSSDDRAGNIVFRKLQDRSEEMFIVGHTSSGVFWNNLNDVPKNNEDETTYGFLIKYGIDTLKYIFMPLSSSKKWFDDFETEDNDNFDSADPLTQFQQEYTGYYDDEKDYFSFYIPQCGTVSISMITDLDPFPGGREYSIVQLLLYSDSDRETYLAREAKPPFLIEKIIEKPGKFYLLIYTDPNFTDPTQDYKLHVNFSNGFDCLASK